MAERILQAQRFKNRVAGMKLAAAQDRAALGFFLQGQKGVQRIADAGKGQGIVDGVNDPRRGGPAVEKGHLMGFQQRGRMASGTAFFLHQAGFLIAEQIMVALRGSSTIYPPSSTTGPLWPLRSRRMVISDTPSRAAASFRCSLSLRLSA
jgi:hypothetical protein